MRKVLNNAIQSTTDARCSEDSKFRGRVCHGSVARRKTPALQSTHRYLFYDTSHLALKDLFRGYFARLYSGLVVRIYVKQTSHVRRGCHVEL